MNTPGLSTPALFASVRSSKDFALAAFAVALLVAFALHAGAFLPKLSPSASETRPASIEPARRSPAPAVVARRPAGTGGASTAASEPCAAPRG